MASILNLAGLSQRCHPAENYQHCHTDLADKTQQVPWEIISIFHMWTTCRCCKIWLINAILAGLTTARILALLGDIVSTLQPCWPVPKTSLWLGWSSTSCRSCSYLSPRSPTFVMIRTIFHHFISKGHHDMSWSIYAILGEPHRGL
jgi:hypothetical protein